MTLLENELVDVACYYRGQVEATAAAPGAILRNEVEERLVPRWAGVNNYCRTARFNTAKWQRKQST